MSKQNEDLHSFSQRILHDLDYRTWFFLIVSCFLNLLFTVFNSYQGIRQESQWLCAISGYYAILTVTRLLLIRWDTATKKQTDEFLRKKRELQTFRNTGLGLMLLTLAMTATSVEMILRNQHFTYPYYLSFGVVFIAFYNLVLACLGLKNYHDMRQPILRANKMLGLPTALMSIFFCQTMMLVTFAPEGGDEINHRLMNSLTGGGVLLISLGIALFMIRRGNQALRELKKESQVEKC